MDKRTFIMLWVIGMLLSVASVAQAKVLDGLLEDLNVDQEEIAGSVLGMGVWIQTEPYIGVENQVYPVPIAVMEYKGFYIDGAAFGYTFNDEEEFEFSLIGKPHPFAGYESGDSSMLRGMDDRKGSFDAGGRFRWNHEEFKLTVDAVADLTNRHQGSEITVTLSREFYQGFFTPRVRLKWLSENYVDYYYGVKGNEGTAFRPPYEGEGAFNFVAGFTVAVPVNEEVAIIGDFEYEGLNSEIEDSPIVGDDSIFRYVAGIVYRF